MEYGDWRALHNEIHFVMPFFTVHFYSVSNEYRRHNVLSFLSVVSNKHFSLQKVPQSNLGTQHFM